MVGGHSSAFSAFDAVGRQQVLPQPAAGLPDLRFNDGKVDARGRFWAGTVQEKRVAGLAGLYRLDPDETCRQMVSGITVSNGLAWSPDGRTMYLACSHARTVWARNFDMDGGVPGARRVFAFFDAAEGVPDGATVVSAALAAAPDSGSVFALRPGVSGIAEPEFGW